MNDPASRSRQLSQLEFATNAAALVLAIQLDSTATGHCIKREFLQSLPRTDSRWDANQHPQNEPVSGGDCRTRVARAPDLIDGLENDPRAACSSDPRSPIGRIVVTDDQLPIPGGSRKGGHGLLKLEERLAEQPFFVVSRHDDRDFHANSIVLRFIVFLDFSWGSKLGKFLQRALTKPESLQPLCRRH